MSKLAPPRRAGKAGLVLRLSSGSHYDLYHLRPVSRKILDFMGASRGWRVAVATGPRAGSVYEVLKKRDGRIVCSCPDHQILGSRCKHVGGLISLGLVSARKPRPSELGVGQ